MSAKQSIINYIGSDYYEPINRFLRQNKGKFIGTASDEITDHILRIDQYFVRHQKYTTEPMTVFRGSTTPLSQSGIYYGYLSTSTDVGAASQFTGDNNCCMMRIHVPVKTPYLDLAGLGAATAEAEMLFPRGLHIRLGGQCSIEGYEHYACRDATIVSSTRSRTRTRTRTRSRSRSKSKSKKTRRHSI